MSEFYGYAKKYANSTPMGMDEIAKFEPCKTCNDTGVISWGDVNATGRNENIRYCSCK